MKEKNNQANTEFSRQVRLKEIQKVKARDQSKRSIWSGLGMFGMVGYSVSIPTVLGAIAGIWLDRHYPSTFSWTLALLLGGLSMGCLNALFWVGREQRQMHEGPDPRRKGARQNIKQKGKEERQ